MSGSSSSPPNMSLDRSFLSSLVERPAGVPMQMSFYPFVHDELEENAKKRASLLGYTEGFYAGKWKMHQYRRGTGGIFEVDSRCDVAYTTAQCVMRSENIGLKRLIRANVKGVAGMFYYLTMEGQDGNFYEAKAFVNLQGNTRVDLFRRAVHYPYIDPEILRNYDAPSS
ncbi:hypothetical protein TorRG33x02_245380 [Trema orientale]|uniref:Uncharacterized protein n=1 Tax=Trema orientale TaxID=63057 RepID=A0A2P5DPN5_TREOI|nr:hypothetical protein TorRG33x02_245380 [Trema orientale]